MQFYKVTFEKSYEAKDEDDAREQAIRDLRTKPYSLLNVEDDD